MSCEERGTTTAGFRAAGRQSRTGVAGKGLYEWEVEGAFAVTLRLLTSCKASETACRAWTCFFHASLARFARITNNTLFIAPRNLTFEDLLNEFGDGAEGAPTA